MVCGEPASVAPFRVDPAPVENSCNSTREMMRLGRPCEIGGSEILLDDIQHHLIGSKGAVSREGWQDGVDVWQAEVRIRQTVLRSKWPTVGVQCASHIGVNKTRCCEIDRLAMKPLRKPINEVCKRGGQVLNMFHAVVNFGTI